MPFFHESQNTVVTEAVMVDNSILQTIHYDNRKIGLSAKQLLSPSIAAGAFHNSEERHDPPKCHPETRVQVLSGIMEWISNPHRQKHVFWLNGPAGAGKSAIAQTTAEECSKQQLLAASFFFSRSVATRNNSAHFVTTLAYQLLNAYPDLAKEIAQVLEGDPSIVHKSLEYQAEKLIVEPFLSWMLTFSGIEEYSSKVVIIDGLDECRNEEQQCRILELVARLSQSNGLPLCFFISCRREHHISDQFAFTDLAHVSQELSLHNVESADNDIKTYLKSGFARIHNLPAHRFSMKNVTTPWPTDDVIWHLAWRSSGQFIYASTVLRFVGDRNSLTSPADQLQVILNIKDAPDNLNPLAALDAMYSEILSRAHNIQLTLKVLGCLISNLHASGGTRISPLLLAEKVIRLQPYEVYSALLPLHSLMVVSEPGSDDYRDPWMCFKFYHASFTQFLEDQNRSGEYFIDLRQINMMITISFIRTLSTFDSKDSNSDYVALVLSYVLLHDALATAEKESEELYNELTRFDVASSWLAIMDIRNADLDSMKVCDTLSLLENREFQNWSLDMWCREVWWSLSTMVIESQSLSSTWNQNCVFINPKTGDTLNYSEKFQNALDKLFRRNLEPFLPISKEDKTVLGLRTLAAMPGKKTYHICRYDLATLFAEKLHPFISEPVYHTMSPPLFEFLMDENRSGPFYLTEDIRSILVIPLLKKIYSDSYHTARARYARYVKMLLKDTPPTSELISALHGATDFCIQQLRKPYAHDAVPKSIIMWLRSSMTRENTSASDLLIKWTSPLWSDSWTPYSDDKLQKMLEKDNSL